MLGKEGMARAGGRVCTLYSVIGVRAEGISQNNMVDRDELGSSLCEIKLREFSSPGLERSRCHHLK